MSAVDQQVEKAHEDLNLDDRPTSPIKFPWEHKEQIISPKKTISNKEEFETDDDDLFESMGLGSEVNKRTHTISTNDTSKNFDLKSIISQDQARSSGAPTLLISDTKFELSNVLKSNQTKTKDSPDLGIQRTEAKRDPFEDDFLPSFLMDNPRSRRKRIDENESPLEKKVSSNRVEIDKGHPPPTFISKIC
ncbi:hypothetical protein HK096_005311 [Nowakowskiella sp. JEL0078]|nr:hypothetical protein HK096_005311 [Nowakowskiella sp. JEL0078]